MQKTMIIILLIILIILLGAANLIMEHENEVLRRRNKRLYNEVDFRERRIKALSEQLKYYKSREAAAKDEICT